MSNVEDVNILGNRLKSLREKKGLSQNSLAKILDINPMSVVNYETGKRTPDAKLIVRMSRHLGCTSDYLLGLNDIQAFDMERQKINKMLGLSEKAIEQLIFHKEHKYDERIIKLVNLLIEQTEYPPFEEHYHYWRDENDFFDEEKFDSDLADWKARIKVNIIGSLANYFYTESKSGKEFTLYETGDIEERKKNEKGFTVRYFEALKTIGESQIVESVLFMDLEDKLKEFKKQYKGIPCKKAGE